MLITEEGCKRVKEPRDCHRSFYLPSYEIGLLLRFEVIYHRPVKKRLLGVLTSIYNRGWLIFDFVIIVVSVLDVYVISFMTTVSTVRSAPTCGSDEILVSVCTHLFRCA